MAMTNAERQKRYRDRKRCGPLVGRWHGHRTAKQFGAENPTGERVGRSMVFMIAWLQRHLSREDFLALVAKEKVTPLYRRLKRQHDYRVGVEFLRAQREGKGAG
jgi:hypothetical protein